MAYALHIERNEESISLDEWSRAVATVDGARIDSSGAEGINPQTGEAVRIGANDGDVAVLFKTGGLLGFGQNAEWVTSITFFEGRASFKATEDIDSPNNPVRVVASRLAKFLNAKIVGDEGEEYEW